MKNYFTHLGFLPDEIILGPAIVRRRMRLAGIAYLCFVGGIFSRQISAFPKVDLDVRNVRWSVLAASFLIGLAVFPYLIRRFNRKRRKPNWEHWVFSFSFGFFLNLAMSPLVKWVP